VLVWARRISIIASQQIKEQGLLILLRAQMAMASLCSFARAIAIQTLTVALASCASNVTTTRQYLVVLDQVKKVSTTASQSQQPHLTAVQVPMATALHWQDAKEIAIKMQTAMQASSVSNAMATNQCQVAVVQERRIGITVMIQIQCDVFLCEGIPVPGKTWQFRGDFYILNRRAQGNSCVWSGNPFA
jgi:hypothetical protein